MERLITKMDPLTRVLTEKLSKLIARIINRPPRLVQLKFLRNIHEKARTKRTRTFSNEKKARLAK